MNFWKEFFSWDFERIPEGYMSWQHILIVTVALVIATICAILISQKNKNQDEKRKMRVLKVAAILLDGFESIKLIIYCIMGGGIQTLLGNLPLFLCSIPLIVLPIAAFSKGRLQKASIDFMIIWGLIAALAGTYLAGNIYGSFPVLHFHTMVSLTTHMITGFSALYIGFSRLFSFKKENIILTMGILGVFMATAAIVNILNRGSGYQSNYMFLSSGDGTPFTIFENIFGSYTILYGLSVALLMWTYMLLFILIVSALRKVAIKRKALATR